MSANDETLVLPEVTMTDELAKAIHDAVSSADVKSLIMDAATKEADTRTQLAADQAVAEKAAADKIVADKAAADAAAVAAISFKRTENIGGKNFEFDGTSEAEVDRLVLNAYKIAYAVRAPEAAQAVVDPAIAAAEAQKAAEAEVLAKVELERKFRAGEVTPAEYIQQSGALKQYLESEGVSLDSLKSVVTANKSTQFKQSWADAGETFRNSAAGKDWPGGLKNQELIGLKIAAMGLEDAPDKVAALAQAYADMKHTGLYFPNGDGDVVVPAVAAPAAAAVVVVDPAVAAADAAAATARAVAAAKVQSMSSSIFGASSGMSGAAIVSPAVTDAKKVVPADATPAEIMQAWKEAQVAQGKDVNSAFLAEHRNRG